MKFFRNIAIAIVCVMLVTTAFIVFKKEILPHTDAQTTKQKTEEKIDTKESLVVNTTHEESKIPPTPVVTHITTPKTVKAVYMSSWVAGTTLTRDKLISLIDETEINAVVVDVKDSTGIISYKPLDETLASYNTWSTRISNLPALITLLHEKGIYVIGRVAVFQDPTFAKTHPELAIKKQTDKNALWGDDKGLYWLDAGEEVVWDYTIAIARDAYTQGFDEINVDYVRFPSDGKLKDMYLPSSEGKEKSEVIKSFFAYISSHLRDESRILLSADIFGMTTVATTDMGIGQVFEKILPYVDFVAPMVYPSHFANNYEGFKNPAEHPYEVINITMKKAVERAEALGEPKTKIRPWLQDFNMGATYTKELIRAQIKGATDAGLDSYMMWDPRNKYTRDAYTTTE